MSVFGKSGKNDDSEEVKPINGLFSRKRNESENDSVRTEPSEEGSEFINPPSSMTPVRSKDFSNGTMKIKSKGIKPPASLVILYSVGGILIVLGIVAFIFVYILKKPLPFVQKVKENYSVSASTKSEQVLGKMKEIIKGYNLEFASEKKTKYIRKKSGFQVIQRFNEQKAAENYVVYLRKKKIPAKVVNDPEDGIYIQVWGVFPNGKKATVFSKKATQVMKTPFEVAEHFKKIPYSVYEIQVKGIPDEMTALKLKEQLSSLKPRTIEIKKETE